MYPSHFIHYKIIGIFAKNSFRFRLDYYFDYYPTTRCPGMPILSAFSSGSKGARTPDLSRVRRTLIPAELCFHNYAMRITGLEPARLLTIEPKSIASATSAISAY